MAKVSEDSDGQPRFIAVNASEKDLTEDVLDVGTLCRPALYDFCESCPSDGADSIQNYNICVWFAMSSLIDAEL